MQTNSIKTGAAHQLATGTDDKKYDPELERLMAASCIAEWVSVATNYERHSSQKIKSLCWNLLQTPETPTNLPLLMAFGLAMDLLEGKEYAEHWEQEGSDPQETPASPSEVIAAFWRGVQGFGHCVHKGIPQGEREAITGAALAMVALSPEKVKAGDASKKRGYLPEAIPAQKRAPITRERETDPTEEHFASV